VLDALQARPELARHASVQGLDGLAVLHADVLPCSNGRWPLRRSMRWLPSSLYTVTLGGLPWR
jgi:hypothetical protein